MTLEQLEDKLDNLGYKAVSLLAGVELDKKGSIIDNSEKFEILYENPTKLFYKMDRAIIEEIRSIYKEIQARSFKEEYDFIGANYNTLVK